MKKPQIRIREAKTNQIKTRKDLDKYNHNQKITLGTVKDRRLYNGSPPKIVVQSNNSLPSFVKVQKSQEK